MKVDRTHFLMDPAGAISSADKAGIRESATRNVAKIAELERIVGFLIAKMIQNQPVSLADEPVRRFLRLPEDAARDPMPYLQRVLSALEPKGLVECGECQSAVRDIPGFLDESCPICGAHVGTAG